MPATPTWVGYADLIEPPTSRKLVKDDFYHLTQILIGPYDNCVADAPAKGTAGSGVFTGYICEQSTVTRDRGDVGNLVIEWISGTLPPLPAPEVMVVGDNQSPRTERHPMFESLEGVPEALANVETACRAQDETQRNTAYESLNSLGKRLVDKIRRGQETYYFATLRYSWVTYLYNRPTLSRGGFVEPVDGPLRNYFDTNISWLRQADELSTQNGLWRLVKSWYGAPHGHWDGDIYPV